jgi:hypothetical protein
MLHTLGFYRSGETFNLRAPDASLFGADAVAAVDAFRASETMGPPTVGGSPAGLVDPETVDRLWAALARAGKADAVRQQLLDITMGRRESPAPISSGGGARYSSAPRLSAASVVSASSGVILSVSSAFTAALRRVADASTGAAGASPKKPS